MTTKKKKKEIYWEIFLAFVCPFFSLGRALSTSLIAQMLWSFYIFQEVVVFLQIWQQLAEIKLVTVKTVDLPTSITKHNRIIRLTFANVKQWCACLRCTSLLQCHPQDLPLYEILCVSIYIGNTMIGFRWASKVALWAHCQTVNWFAGISVSCVITLGGWIYGYVWPRSIVTVLHTVAPGCRHQSLVSCRDRCSLFAWWYVKHMCTIWAYAFMNWHSRMSEYINTPLTSKICAAYLYLA